MCWRPKTKDIFKTRIPDLLPAFARSKCASAPWQDRWDVSVNRFTLQMCANKRGWWKVTITLRHAFSSCNCEVTLVQLEKLLGGSLHLGCSFKFGLCVGFVHIPVCVNVHVCRPAFLPACLCNKVYSACECTVETLSTLILFFSCL